MAKQAQIVNSGVSIKGNKKKRNSKVSGRVPMKGKKSHKNGS